MKKYKRELPTVREAEVCRLLSLGCSVPETAKILGVAAPTADNHKSRLMSKLGVNKAALLTRVAIQMKITSMADHLTMGEKRKSGRKKDGWN